VHPSHVGPHQPVAHCEVDDATIDVVREGRPLADAKLEALCQFAAKVTRQRGVVSEADVAALKTAGYDNRVVLDVLVPRGRPSSSPTTPTIWPKRPIMLSSKALNG
jgi:hypothetical protein